jgi:metal iron transporter
MNCPSRVDPIFTEGWNQNPNALDADSTTRADLEHMANARLRRDHKIETTDAAPAEIEPNERNVSKGDSKTDPKALDAGSTVEVGEQSGPDDAAGSVPVFSGSAGRATKFGRHLPRQLVDEAFRVLKRYAKFVGPGFMVAVAYIDPGKRFP